ncbi:MAG: class I SAM-dependent DNA methyltransferase [Candidatus Pelagibacterales bacterium]|nr:class I SAM-dependent methyltransferase [Pelagibacteraceae bacterium]
MKDWLKTVYSETSSSKLNKHYKNWANLYDTDMSSWGYAYPLQLNKILTNKLKLKKTIKILDAGCGTGYVAEVLSKLNYKNITGIDFSEEMLTIARSKKIYKKLMCQSLNEKIELRSKQFELIICTGVLTSGHVGPSALHELVRILKPQGFFICSIAESVYKKNGFEKEIKNLKNLVSIKSISKAFVALPNNKNSAKSRMYILEKLN